MGSGRQSKDHRKSNKSKDEHNQSRHRSDKSKHTHSSHHRSKNSPSHHKESKRVNKDRQDELCEEKKISQRNTSHKTESRKITEKVSKTEKPKTASKIRDGFDSWNPELPPIHNQLSKYPKPPHLKPQKLAEETKPVKLTSKSNSERSRNEAEVISSSKTRHLETERSHSSKNKDEVIKSETSKVKSDNMPIKPTLGTLLLSKDKEGDVHTMNSQKVKDTPKSANSKLVGIEKLKSMGSDQKTSLETYKTEDTQNSDSVKRVSKFSTVHSDWGSPDSRIVNVCEIPVVSDVRTIMYLNEKRSKIKHVDSTFDSESFVVVDTSIPERLGGPEVSDSRMEVDSFSISHSKIASSSQKLMDMSPICLEEIIESGKEVKSSKRRYKRYSSDDESQNSIKRSKGDRIHKMNKLEKHKKQSKRRRKSEESDSSYSSSSNSSSSSRYYNRKRRHRCDRRSPGKRGTKTLGSFFDPNIARELLIASINEDSMSENQENSNEMRKPQTTTQPSTIQINKQKMMMSDYHDKWAETDRQALLFEMSTNEDSPTRVEVKDCDYMSLPIIECPHLLKDFLNQSTINELMFGGYVESLDVEGSQKKWRRKVLADNSFVLN